MKHVKLSKTYLMRVRHQEVDGYANDDICSIKKVADTVPENLRVDIREITEDFNLPYGSTQHLNILKTMPSRGRKTDY